MTDTQAHTNEPPPMLVHLTCEDLAGLITTAVETAITRVLAPKAPQQYATSLKEFASIIDKSETTVWRMKNDGILDGALHQYGHSIIVDIEMAKQCMKQAKFKRKNKKPLKNESNNIAPRRDTELQGH